MNRHLGLLVSTLALLGVARAQDATTTLDALTQRAEIVVRATVVAATDPSPLWHRLEFTVQQVLHGSVGTTFELLEPAGACCGRSLFALQPGDERLLFLHHTGQTQHPLGGARGVLPAEPALVAHVQALLGTTLATARTALLADSLDADDPRIAGDAAAALGAMPQLALDPSRRTAVTAALRDAVRRGSTRTAPLATIAARLGDDATLDACLPIYLETPRDDQAALLRRAFASADADTIALRLPMHVRSDHTGSVQRAAELLAALPAASARPALQQLLQTAPHPRVQLTLAEGLLDAGLRPAALSPFVPAPVLELAQQRHDRPRPLRNVRPNRP